MAATQVVGATGMAVLILLLGQPAPLAPALAWAGLAGLSGIVGLFAFYRALASGSMSLAAPVAAAIGAGIPAAVGIVGGEPLVAAQLLGVVLAICAVVVVSATGAPQGSVASAGRLGRIPQELPVTLLAGLGFAGFFLAVDRAAAFDPSPWWLLLAVRLAGLSAVLPVLVWVLRRPAERPRIGRRLAALLLLAGIADLGGNAFFVLARFEGLLSLAVVLSSLYPVITVLLAVALLHERLRPPQLLGVAMALVAIALIALPA